MAKDPIVFYLTDRVLPKKASQLHQLQSPAMFVDSVLSIDGLCQNLVGQGHENGRFDPIGDFGPFIF